MEYLLVKWLHIVSSTFLFGTGVGSAFYMFFASRTREPRVIAAVVKYVVIADWVFTTPTVVLQPLTGWYLLHLLGTPWRSTWIAASIALFVVAGACWLPVVWMQMRMRDMAERAARDGAELPPPYWRYFRRWIAFAALVVVFYLMVTKPA
jgi:uncharacterized membrane protein